MQRRELLKGMFAAGVAVVAGRVARVAAAPTAGDGAVADRLAVLELRSGGRLGVAALDTGSGASVAHRGDEAFLMCSTFKVLLAAAVLARVDHGAERLDRRVVFGKGALLDWAPVARTHAGPPGMTVAQLCEAALTLSDNTAANLLIESVGGPAAVTRYARGLGDAHTLLDRVEPDMNAYCTTTPRATLGNLRKLLLGDALSISSRRRLTGWMLDCQTGQQSLRAGLPADWRVGDKTGQWDGNGIGVNNDIAILWPPRRKPLLVTAYCTTATADVAARKAVLAEVGRIVSTL